jgi:uncharacterized protein (DUF302 family)
LLVGYFLPCKIVLYEDNQVTKIGMPRPSSMIEMLKDDDLKALAEDIEKRLIGYIDRSV